MKEPKTDDTFLWHMYQAIENIRTFTAALTFKDYNNDLILISAVERQFEVLGEAARRVSDKLKAQHPGIPWQKIVDLRNVIIHQYDGVDQDIIWQIIDSELPALKTSLEGILESKDQSTDIP